MDMNELVAPFEGMLARAVTSSAIRQIECGGDIAPMWDEIGASGFLDALIPEQRGGPGLTLAAINALWQALGRYAVPLPVGETMIARALLSEEELPAPEGPITLAFADSGGPAVAAFGMVASHVLIERGDRIALCKLSGPGERYGEPYSLSSRFSADVEEQASFAAKSALRPSAAVLSACLIAGAAARLVEMSAAYANERIQFGKPIGRQQALQQNLAVAAEEMVAARIGSQIGCAGAFPPSLPAAAIAKSIASRAATRIAETAHAIHGAIGISAEHDLQLLTRRLHEWRLAEGSESYWYRFLGAERLRDPGNSLDHVRRIGLAWPQSG